MHPSVAQSLLVRRPAPLKGFLTGSVIAHVSLLILGLGYQYFTAGPSIDLNQKPIKATLVRRGKPRDENLLPRKEELPPPPQKSEGTTPPTPTPAPSDKAVAVPVPGLKPASKDAAKQAGEDKGVDRRKQLFGAFSKTSKATKAEELEGAIDGDPFGDSATQEGDPYFGTILSQIRRHFNVPSTISEQEAMHLKATVVLVIGRNGQVLKTAISQKSGNATYDSAVKAAVMKASPLSPPPEHLRDALGRQGVAIVMRPFQ